MNKMHDEPPKTAEIPETPDPNDVLYTINKYIKYKSSGRKSYIRTKVIECNMTDDITQMCYKLYDAIENKTVVINDNQENIDMKRKLLKYENEIRELNEFKIKYETSNRYNKQKSRLLEERNQEITQLKITLKSKEDEIKILKGIEKPSVFDECEPVIKASIPDDYDPYNQKIEYLPLNMNDYSPIDIHHVRGQVGSDLWDRMSDMEKLDKMSDPQYL
tara:strand:+ start:938 stop:1591 length:654 start_codon:yes stop_codon:yes gene_type:complete